MQDTVTKDREKYLGGSDIPSVMGISPFTKRMDMLSFKAGIKENDFDGNEYTRYGNAMEGKIRDYINMKMGYDFHEDKRIIKDDVLPTRYHADGIDIDKKTVLEVKTTSDIKEDVNGYKVYLVQLLFGMHTFGYDKGLLAVYERPEDMSEEFDETRLTTCEIKAEDYKDLWDSVEQGVANFKKDLVFLKENPLATEEELPSLSAVAKIGVKTLTIGDKEFTAEWLLGAEKTLTDAIKSLKDELCEQMEEHGIKHCDFSSGARVTFVPKGEDTEQMKFDEKKFAAENPDLYEKYLEKKTKKGKKAYVLIKH